MLENSPYLLHGLWCGFRTSWTASSGGSCGCRPPAAETAHWTGQPSAASCTTHGPCVRAGSWASSRGAQLSSGQLAAGPGGRDTHALSAPPCSPAHAAASTAAASWRRSQRGPGRSRGRAALTLSWPAATAGWQRRRLARWMDRCIRCNRGGGEVSDSRRTGAGCLAQQLARRRQAGHAGGCDEAGHCWLKIMRRWPFATKLANFTILREIAVHKSGRLTLVWSLLSARFRKIHPCVKKDFTRMLRTVLTVV